MNKDLKEINNRVKSERKKDTTIGFMECNISPNLVLMKHGYWFVAEEISGLSMCGKDSFIEFELVEDVDFQFIKNRFKMERCLNCGNMFKPNMSVNARNIISIQKLNM